MKQTSLNYYKEAKSVIVAILLLTLIFGFNDNKAVFILKNWIANLVNVAFIVSLVLLFNIIGYKLTAKYLGTIIKLKTWNNQKFKEKLSLKSVDLIYSTPILPILIMIISNGKIFFSSILTFTVEKIKLIGKGFPHIREYDVALIVLAGMFFNFILMLLFKLTGIDLGVKISSWFILMNFLPFSELPGAKLFMGSRALYFFSLIFFAVNILFLNILSIMSAILLSALFSSIFAVVYFYFFEYMKS